jgi:hypothetical protein
MCRYTDGTHVRCSFDFSFEMCLREEQKSRAPEGKRMIGCMLEAQRIGLAGTSFASLAAYKARQMRGFETGASETKKSSAGSLIRVGGQVRPTHPRP